MNCKFFQKWLIFEELFNTHDHRRMRACAYLFQIWKPNILQYIEIAVTYMTNFKSFQRVSIANNEVDNFGV